MTFQRLPINDFDKAGITNEVNRWQENQRYASYNLANAATGRASMVLQDPFRANSRFLKVDITKYGEKKFIGWRKAWVTEVAEASTERGPFVSLGYVGGGTLARLLTDTIKCIETDIYPFSEFGVAANTFLLR
ncbi:MAG: hypothetical protein AAFY80_09430 [Pseudomonadota bacterium]